LTLDVAVEDLALDTEAIPEDETVTDELEGAAMRKSEENDPDYEQEQETATLVQQMDTNEQDGDDSIPVQ
jgi:hypothetical protein